MHWTAVLIAVCLVTIGKCDGQCSEEDNIATCGDGFQFPLKVSESITKLVVHSKDLKTISDEDLAKYTELKEVDFSNSNIETINPNAFSKNEKLEIINLSHNKDLKIPTNAIFDSKSVHTLILADTGTTVLSDDAFTELPNLSTLDLRENKIEDIEKALENAKNLEKLIIAKDDNIDQGILCETTSLKQIVSTYYDDNKEEKTDIHNCVDLQQIDEGITEEPNVEVNLTDKENHEEEKNEEPDDENKEDTLKEEQEEPEKVEEVKNDEQKIEEVKTDDTTNDEKPKDDEVKDDKVKEDEVKEDEVKEDEVKEDEVKEDEVKENDVKNDEKPKDDTPNEEKSPDEISPKVDVSDTEVQKNIISENDAVTENGETSTEFMNVGEIATETDDIDQEAEENQAIKQDRNLPKEEVISNDINNETKSDEKVGESTVEKSGMNGSSIVLGIIVVIVVLGAIGMGYKYWKNHRGYHNTRTDDIEEGKELKTISSNNKSLIEQNDQ